VFWVISVYFNIRNTLPKSGTFLLGQPVYKNLNLLRPVNVASHVLSWNPKTVLYRKEHTEPTAGTYLNPVPHYAHTQSILAFFAQLVPPGYIYFSSTMLSDKPMVERANYAFEGNLKERW